MILLQKLCVTGKGGSGKSTIASVIARILADRGYDVLVMDNDESNPSLYRKLGMEKEPVPLISYLERFNLEYGIPEATWLSQDNIYIEDIPDEFLVKKGNISLMEIGKIDHSLQGCACSMADLSKQLMKNLRLKEGQVVIADLEAGVESFGRGIEQGADTVIAVTETSFDSVKLAESIRKMADDIGIKRVYSIYNRIPEEISEKMICQVNSGETGSDVLGIMRYEKEVMLSGFSGDTVPRDTRLYMNTEKMLDIII